MNNKIDKMEYDLIALENTTHSLSGAILPIESSPRRPLILNSPSKLPKGIFNIIKMFIIALRNGKGIKSRSIAIQSIANIPKKPFEYISSYDLQEFEIIAKKKGINLIGYTHVSRENIFQDKGILFDKAIILCMEMDKECIDKAPGIEAMSTVLNVYTKLGIAINELTDWLHSKNYAAHAGNPMKGLVLFPVLGASAGLGWHGRHGLLITPEFGPRQRIGAIFIGVNNLPINKEANKHKWIEKYCLKCGRCIKMCPGKAIYDKPIVNINGRLTHIDNTRCFVQFYEALGCAVCIKECTFNKISYETLLKKSKENI